MNIDPQIRKQLIMLARRPKAQEYALPEKWMPRTVRNPDGVVDEYFTDMSAWELIAVQLENGCEVEETKLHKHQHKTAYVLKLKLSANDPMLYIKVQLGSGTIIGWSFHYTKHL